MGPKFREFELLLFGNLVKLPKLRAPNLKNLTLSCCVNLVKLPKLWSSNLGPVWMEGRRKENREEYSKVD